MKDKYGQDHIATAKHGIYLVPRMRKGWSRPVQTEIETPMDCFCVTQHHGRTDYSDAFNSSSVRIRLESSGRVYVGVQAYDSPSALKSVTLDWDKFVRRLGTAMFDAEEVRAEP